MKTLCAGIIGTGSALPEKIITNADFAKIVDTSDEWITERTGIKERHVSAEGEGLSVYATRAAERALEMANLKAENLDLIVCATISPDMYVPSAASYVQANLGAEKIPAFDINAACSGFIFALTVGEQFIKTGKYKKVLAIGGEMLTKFTDYTDRSTCVLFGDGVGAVVLAPFEDGEGILSSRIYNDGTMADYLTMPGGGSRNPASHKTVDNRMHFVKMKGNETFKMAVRYMTQVSQDVLKDAGFTTADVDLFIPHQANKRITDAVLARLAIPEEKAYENIKWTGNTSAGSIPIALDEAVRKGLAKKNDLVLLTAFGGGLTWGASLMRWAI